METSNDVEGREKKPVSEIEELEDRLRNRINKLLVKEATRLTILKNEIMRELIEKNRKWRLKHELKT